MADGLGGLGQRVSPVDHRYDLPGFGEFGGGGQVGLVGGDLGGAHAIRHGQCHQAARRGPGKHQRPLGELSGADRVEDITRREANRSPHACAADGAAIHRTAAGRVRSPHAAGSGPGDRSARATCSRRPRPRGPALGGRARARPLPPTGGGTACRAASPRPRLSSSSSWLRASAGPSSCMSSITSQSRSSSRTRSVSSRSVIAHPSRSGAAVTPAPVPTLGPSGAARPAATSRTAAVPLLPARRHPRGPFCQAGLAGPRPPQDRLPAPRRADATVTRADASSRLNSPGRDTTPPGPGQVTGRQRHPMPGPGPWPDHHTKPAGIPNRRAVRPISAATDRRSLSSSASSTRRSGLAGLGQRRLPLAGWFASSPRSTAGRRSGEGSRASC